MKRAVQVRGFTLLELLVVLTLISVLMLAMGSALSTIAKTEERIDQRLLRADNYRVAAGFLRTSLGRVSARKISGVVKEGSTPYLFTGTEEAVQWIGIMPARYGAGGRSFFRLAVEDQRGVASLVIRYAPWVDASEFPDWSQMQAHVLVAGVTSFALAYEDAKNTPAEWTPAWLKADRLPHRIRMTLQTVSGPWPDMVIPLRILAPSENRRGGFSLGPE